jgi:hypothetical protein
MNRGRGFGGNREVPPLVLLELRGDLSGAWLEAYRKEGGSWGKHGFTHGSEPQARDAHAAGRPFASNGVPAQRMVRRLRKNDPSTTWTPRPNSVKPSAVACA